MTVPPKKSHISDIVLLLKSMAFLYFLSHVVNFNPISSRSMHGTLRVGDVIIRNVASVGGVTPRILFQIPFVSYAYKKWYSKFVRLPQFRIYPSGEIKKGEIIIFQNIKEEASLTEDIIKRVVAVPNDTILIKNGKTFVNGEKSPWNNVASLTYVVELTRTLPRSFLKKIEEDNDEVPLLQTIQDKKGNVVSYQYKLTINSQQEEMLDKVLKQNNIVQINRELDKTLGSTGFQNNMPTEFRVPSKDFRIELDEKCHALYIECLKNKYGENFVVKEEKEKKFFFLNGCRIYSYTFIENYFFMKGDNAQNSYDSTQHGPVPEHKIRGKCTRIICSVKGNSLWSLLTLSFRWDRFFKRIN